MQILVHFSRFSATNKSNHDDVWLEHNIKINIREQTIVGRDATRSFLEREV